MLAAPQRIGLLYDTGLALRLPTAMLVAVLLAAAAALGERLDMLMLSHRDQRPHSAARPPSRRSSPRLRSPAPSPGTKRCVP